MPQHELPQSLYRASTELGTVGRQRVEGERGGYNRLAMIGGVVDSGGDPVLAQAPARMAGGALGGGGVACSGPVEGGRSAAT